MDRISIEKVINANGIPTYKHSEKIVKEAEFIRMLTTLEKQEDVVISLRASETELQKEQRTRLYKSMTKFLTAKIMGYYNLLSSIDDVKKKVEHSNKEFESKIRNQIAKFGGTMSLEQYLFEKTKYYEATDPNAVVLVEFSDTVNREGVTIRTCYPLEIPSVDIVELKKEKGRISEILVRIPKKIVIRENGKDTELDAFDFILYQNGIQTIYERVASQGENSGTGFKGYFRKADHGMITKRTEIYKVSEYLRPYDIDFAFQFGKRPDYSTNGETVVSILSAASEQFVEIIFNKSELDLSIYLHVFQKMILAGFPCHHTTEVGTCESGQIGGKTCESCGGHGVNYPTSSQDVIHVAIPDGLQNIPVLSQLIQYVSPPEQVPAMLLNRLETIQSQISNAIFDFDIFSVNNLKVQPAETATKSVIDHGKLFNVFKHDTSHISEMFVGIGSSIASYVSNGTPSESLDDLVMIHAFPNNYKFETLEELIQKFANVKMSGVGYDVLKSIKLEIIKKLHPDNEVVQLRAIAQLNWQPFAELDNAQINNILLSRAEDDFDKVLYENFGNIMSDIEAENSEPEFYEMAYQIQRKVIQAKVLQYSASIKNVITPANDFFPLNS